MPVKNIIVELETEEQKITGTFRGLLTVGTDDILVLGNEKSSILISFDNINISSIEFTHTDNKISPFGNGIANKTVSRKYSPEATTIVIEKYIPADKQKAFMILTGISTKYKNDKNIIDTENFDTIDNGLQYCIMPDNTFKFGPEHSKNDNIPANNYIEPYRKFGNVTNTQTKTVKKEKPRVTKDKTITTFMNKVLNGYSYKRSCHGGKCSTEETA